MEITDVRVKKVDGINRLRGIASITIDGCFVVHEIRIIEGKDGIFVAMPSREVSDGVYRDVAHPINAETRAIIEKAVLAAYEQL